MLHSLSAQVSYYSDYIQSHPGWLYSGVYSDEAITGTKEKRDGFQSLLNDCRAGKVDLVLTKSISRFARNTVTLLESVRELKSLGIDVFFEEQNIHTLSGEGELMLTILASYALRDDCITDYVSEYGLKHMTTGAIMKEALEAGYIDEAQGNKIWGDMLLRKRKLGYSSFTEYLEANK